MKGYSYVSIMMAVIVVVLVIALSFAYWNQIVERVAKAAPGAFEGVMGGFAVLGRKFCPKNCRPKKGIVLTTTLMATVIFVVIVAVVLFLLYASIAAQAPSTGGAFFYGIFDAIMKMISG